MIAVSRGLRGGDRPARRGRPSADPVVRALANEPPTDAGGIPGAAQRERHLQSRPVEGGEDEVVLCLGPAHLYQAGLGERLFLLVEGELRQHVEPGEELRRAAQLLALGAGPGHGLEGLGVLLPPAAAGVQVGLRVRTVASGEVGAPVSAAAAEVEGPGGAGRDRDDLAADDAGLPVDRAGAAGENPPQPADRALVAAEAADQGGGRLLGRRLQDRRQLGVGEGAPVGRAAGAVMKVALAEMIVRAWGDRKPPGRERPT
jgi:hypothetical protein